MDEDKLHLRYEMKVVKLGLKAVLDRKQNKGGAPDVNFKSCAITRHVKNIMEN